MNDDDNDVSKVLKTIATKKWLSIKVTFRDNHWCAEMSVVSKIETEAEIETETKIETNAETKTESRERSDRSTMIDSKKKLWFEMLRFVKLKTLVDESIWSDWRKTCLFTNNAFSCSRRVVSKFRKIRNSIEFSWIFALLTLTISIRIVWARFVNLTTLLLETRWEFVNVKSSLENMTISLRLNFVIEKTSCETTLKSVVICRLCSFICVIIVCQSNCADEVMREIIECCMTTRTAARTKATAKTTKTTKITTEKTTTTKITAKEHRADSDDVDRDVDSDDDDDSKSEILFWKSFWESFWKSF